MRILVTNDDGVAAPGLAIAERIAEEIARESAGDRGEVWVAAPAFEQSGVSHAISFTSPVKVEQLAERRFAVSGTPADCVILAVHDFMADAPPDLVISGVNRGHNVAEDAVYSGTVGGAIEAALQRTKGIALSQYYRRPASGETPADMFDAAAKHGAAAVRKLLAFDWAPDQFFNVNFPPVPGSAVRGFRFAPQGRRARGAFGAEARTSPGGRSYFWIAHRMDNLSAGPDADSTLCAEGWATITPMRPDYTDVAALEAAIASDGDA
ncbi:MAG: 5'/3'-nucleotidase SurE [Pseudomonadota bacterium]